MNLEIQALLKQLQNTVNDASIWLAIGNILQQHPNEHFNCEQTETTTLSIDKLTATTCYQKAIALDPQNPEYWWRLGSSIMPDETVTIAHQSYDKQQCFMRAISLDKKCAEAWCHLGATIKPGESITIRIHTNQFQYSRQTCFVISISSALGRPELWILLASFMKQDEVLHIQGKSYNSRQCYCHVLEMEGLPLDVELSAWMGLHKQMAENECLLIKGIAFNKDDCAYKILISDNGPISFDAITPSPSATSSCPEVSPSNNQIIAPVAVKAMFDSNQSTATLDDAKMPNTGANADQPPPYQAHMSLTQNSCKSTLRPDAKPFQLSAMNAYNQNPIVHLQATATGMAIPRLEINQSKPHMIFIGFHPSPSHNHKGQRECLTCKTPIEAEDTWDFHVLTARHLDNVAAEEKAYYAGKRTEIIKDQRAPQPHYCCMRCHSIISGNKNYSLHVEGLRHKRRGELMQQAKCCGYIYCDENELYRHKGERSSCAAFFAQREPHAFNNRTPGIAPVSSVFPIMSKDQNDHTPMVGVGHGTLLSSEATNTNRTPPQATAFQSHRQQESNQAGKSPEDNDDDDDEIFEWFPDRFDTVPTFLNGAAQPASQMRALPPQASVADPDDQPETTDDASQDPIYATSTTTNRK